MRVGGREERFEIDRVHQKGTCLNRAFSQLSRFFLDSTDTKKDMDSYYKKKEQTEEFKQVEGEEADFESIREDLIFPKLSDLVPTTLPEIPRMQVDLS